MKISNLRLLEGGYVAIVMVIVIAAILVIIGTSISFLAIDSGQASLSQKKREEVITISEACVAEVLLTLNETATIPSSVSLPEGSCSVVTNSQTGASWTFTVTSTVDGHTKAVQVTADRTTTVDITGWREI